MAKFTDTMFIKVRGGHGGPGCVSFRREKYVARGGPDGGDGGKGGDVYVIADRNYTSLSYLIPDRVYSAKNGFHGEGQNKHGADGDDLVIKLPVGTEVINDDTGELLADLTNEEEMVLIAKGGIGGMGNTFFKTSTMQTPKFAQPGMEGEELTVRLNLKLIADIGLVGLPNSGKSTLLSVLTNATPKIADYPFTTLIPNLGVVKCSENREYTIADIPGIIEGAHKGLGLGLSFLQHIERVRGLLYLIDIDGSDPVYTFELLKSELMSYNENLIDRPYSIVLTKSDLVNNEEDFLKDISSKFVDTKIIAISSKDGYNLDSLKNLIEKMLGLNDAS